MIRCRIIQTIWCCCCCFYCWCCCHILYETWNLVSLLTLCLPSSILSHLNYVSFSNTQTNYTNNRNENIEMKRETRNGVCEQLERHTLRANQTDRQSERDRERERRAKKRHALSKRDTTKHVYTFQSEIRKIYVLHSVSSVYMCTFFPYVSEQRFFFR